MKAEDSFGPSGRAPDEKDFRGGCALSVAAPSAAVSGEMNEARARQLLEVAISPNGDLHSYGWYLSWSNGNDHATLDGKFSAADLEAIAWWMRNAKEKQHLDGPSPLHAWPEGNQQ